ncbi:MAG: citrate/2-methylcitrate synthase [Clostridia bacterium]|nr:citrate/2-methylcitrate synthase [Clostridia bacterium]
MAKINDLVNEYVYMQKNNVKIEPEYYQKYDVKRGLRNQNGTGVLVGLTSIGDVHGYIIDENEKVNVEGRLRFRGVDVNDLVEACEKEDRFGFEETAFLLLFGNLPTKQQLKDFCETLAELRELPNNFTEDSILKFPSNDVMNKLARSVLTLYSEDEKAGDTSYENVIRQSMELIARFPIIVAQAYQTKKHYFDGESLFLHKNVKEYSTAENFLHILRPDNKFTHEEARLLDLCMILHAEHGGGNNSAFTTHVVSSSGTDTYSVVAAAVCALKGPKHGGANHKVMAMMNEIKENVKDWTDKEEVSAYLMKILKKEAFDKSGLIYGMGHAVYTISDPRAVLLKRNAKRLALEKNAMAEFELYNLVEELSPGLFCQYKGVTRPICANVDLYSGFVYSMLNISEDLYTPLFAMARIVGWCAHHIEEITYGGKIIRPAYKSVAKKVQYTSIAER